MTPQAIASHGSKKRKHALTQILALTITASCTAPAFAATPWALFDRSCPNSTSTLEIPCGDLGVYHFAEIVAPAGCSPVHSGIDDGSNYPTPRHSIPTDEGLSGPMPLAAAPSPATPRPTPPGEPWMVVLDFDSDHGESTYWLADKVAGEGITTELHFLDDPSLDPLGAAVNDLHVLANLCRIAEQVDVQGRRPPTAINMSFGRSPDSEDARNAADCSGDRASCQIAQVVAHLGDQGTASVAATGNHKTTLFPAQLQEIVDAGMLELNQFFSDALATGAWETPTPARAHLPGNALCLGDGWPAPAGSSYSSALLAGWIAGLSGEGVAVDLGGNMAPFVPRYLTEQACYVLARGNNTYGSCNLAVGDLLENTLNGGFGRCWQGSRPNIIRGDAVSQAQPIVPMLPFDQWVAGNGPLPEADPCVPCIGELFGPVGQEDLSINMSQSGAIADELTLDGVYLRAGYDFYPLPLASTELGWIEQAEVGELFLPGWGPVVSAAPSSSLVFIMRAPGQESCDAPPTPGCLWTSTALFVSP